jgi:hypothetical protein
MTMERFWPRLLQGTAPLLVWAGHFAFCYLFAAAACTPGGGHAWRWWLPLGVTLLALAACGALLWRACRVRGTGLLALARLGSGWLALVAVGWGGLVLLVSGACR